MNLRKIFIFIMSLSFGLSSFAQTVNEKAYRLHNRLAGVPPTPQTLTAMVNALNANSGRRGYENAAAIAMEHKEFYNTTLKNFFKPFTNQAKTSRVSLNDMTATLVGAVRDSDTKPFSRVLYDDVIYVGPALENNNTDNNSVNRASNRNYQPDRNEHYEVIEDRGLNLRDVLVERRQTENIKTETNPMVNPDNSPILVNGNDGSAGVLTSRAYAEEFFSAGTNRRVTRYTFMNFMCKDFEDLHDTSIPDFKVARDVDRAPGGDSRVYKNTCVGCHAGQDALRGALAYYDFSGNRISYTPGNVRDKMNRGVVFSEGHQTVDDSWINTWAQGQNANLGWRGATSGNGMKEWGQMFAASRAFSECMATRVFKLVCYRNPTEDDDADFIKTMADQFEAGGDYNMKSLIQKSAAKCIEDEYEG